MLQDHSYHVIRSDGLEHLIPHIFIYELSISFASIAQVRCNGSYHMKQHADIHLTRLHSYLALLKVQSTARVTLG